MDYLHIFFSSIIHIPAFYDIKMYFLGGTFVCENC